MTRNRNTLANKFNTFFLLCFINLYIQDLKITQKQTVK